MHGQDTQQAGIFSYLSPEERVPATHPLRPIRQYVDTALAALSPQRAKLYAHTGASRDNGIFYQMTQRGNTISELVSGH